MYSGPDWDLIRPATFSKVNTVETAPVVQAYFTNGFLIRGTRVMGSVALLPRGILHWRVRVALIRHHGTMTCVLIIEVS